MKKMILFGIIFILLASFAFALYSDDYTNVIYENDFENYAGDCHAVGAYPNCTIDTGSVINGSNSLKCTYSVSHQGAACGGSAWTNGSSNFTCMILVQIADVAYQKSISFAPSLVSSQTNVGATYNPGSLGATGYGWYWYGGPWTAFNPAQDYTTTNTKHIYFKVRNDTSSDVEFKLWTNDSTETAFIDGKDDVVINSINRLQIVAWDGSGTMYIDDIVCYTGDELIPVEGDTTPPTIETINCTSCNQPYGDIVEPYETEDTTPTFKITTDENAFCAIADVNKNYTDMVNDDSARNCTDTGGKHHNCTLLPSDALILNKTDHLYIACQDSSGNENTTDKSTSGPLEITVLEVEVQGEYAIMAGINTSTIWETTVYTNQQVYFRYLDSSQVTGTFDKLAIYGLQRWAFNYINSTESPLAGLFNITPSVYTAEYDDMTYQEINDSVRELIDSTKS